MYNRCLYIPKEDPIKIIEGRRGKEIHNYLTKENSTIVIVVGIVYFSVVCK